MLKRKDIYGYRRKQTGADLTNPEDASSKAGQPARFTLRGKLLLLALTLFCSFALWQAVPARADAVIIASGTCGAEEGGGNLTWVLDEDGLLTISGSGAMGTWTSNSSSGYVSPWLYLKDQIISVNLESGVT